MRLIIATILMMLGLFADAQVMQQSNTSQVMRRLSASQYLGLPKVCGAPSLPDGLNLTSQDGAMVLDTCNFRVLIWYNSAWKVVNDSASIPTVASYGKNAGRDSTILLLSNGTRFAAKDSVGSGGGGGGSFTMFDTVGYGLKITNDTIWNPSATGGTITYSGGYTIHTFTSSGTFTFTGPATVEYLIVAGGGGGGGGTGGGGGAGGLIAGSTTLASGSYAVTVGAGGAGGAGQGTPGTNGSNSSFNSNVAIGGGGGGNNLANGLSGGSGGGAGFGKSGGAATSGQGYAGGSATGSNPPNYGSAGGGGAGAVGSVGTNTTGGNGGAGALSSISGTPTYYAGGGGGGTYFGGTLGTGGVGGGGNGGGGNGTPNTGGGGGGQKDNSGASAGSGGSGVVIIRYIAVADTSTLLKADTSILATKALQVASYGKNAGGDSTVLTLFNGTRFAAKDSVGGGGGGGSTKLGTINGYNTKSADGAVISGDTLYMQTADASFPGMVSTGSQTWAGTKTFSSASVIDVAGTGVIQRLSFAQTGGSHFAALVDTPHNLILRVPTNKRIDLHHGNYAGGNGNLASFSSTGITFGGPIGGSYSNLTANTTSGPSGGIIYVRDGGTAARYGMGWTGYEFQLTIPSSGRMGFTTSGGIADGSVNALFKNNGWLIYGSTKGSQNLDPGASSALTISTTTQGSIPAPSMTRAQRIAIASPAQGLQVRDSDSRALWLNLNGSTTTWGALYAAQDTVATDANLTLPVYSSFVILPTITTGRTLTIPAAASYENKTIIIKVANSSANAWTVSPAIKDNTDVDVTTLTNDKVYTIYSDGTNWHIISLY